MRKALSDEIINQYFINKIVDQKHITILDNFSDITFMVMIEKYNMQLFIPKLKIDEITFFSNHVRIKFYKQF